MATKLKPYKLVSIGGTSTKSPEVSAARNTTYSINRLGVTLSSINKTVDAIADNGLLELKEEEKARRVERRQERREKDQAAEKLQERDLKDVSKKPKKTTGVKKVIGKDFSWLTELLSPLTQLMQWIASIAITKEVLDWMKDPANTEKLELFLHKLAFVFEKIYKFASWLTGGIMNTVDQVFGKDKEIGERIAGFGKIALAIAGIGGMISAVNWGRDLLFGAEEAIQAGGGLGGSRGVTKGRGGLKNLGKRTWRNFFRRPKITGTTSKLGKIFSPLTDWFKNVKKKFGFGTKVTGGIKPKSWWDNIFDKFKKPKITGSGTKSGPLSGIKNWFGKTFGSKVTTGSGGNKKGFLSGIWDSVKKINIKNPFKDFKLPKINLKNPFKDFKLPKIDLKNPFKDFKLPKIDIKNPFKDFKLPEMKNPFAGIDFGKQWDKITKGAGSAFDWVKEGTLDNVGKINKGIGDSWNWLWTGTKKNFGVVKDVVGEGVTAVKKTAQNVGAWFDDFINGVWSNVVKQAKKWRKKFGDVVELVKNPGKLLDKAKDVLVAPITKKLNKFEPIKKMKALANNITKLKPADVLKKVQKIKDSPKLVNNLKKLQTGLKTAKSTFGKVTGFDKIITLVEGALMYSLGKRPLINAFGVAGAGMLGYAAGAAVGAPFGGFPAFATGLAGGIIGEEIGRFLINNVIAKTPLANIEDPIMNDGRKLVEPFIFGKIFRGITKTVSNVVSGVGKAVSGVVETVGKVAQNPVVRTVASFIPGVAPVMTAINAVTALANGDIGGAIMSGIGAAAGGAFDFVNAGISDAVTNFTNSTIGQGIMGIGQGLMSGDIGGAIMSGVGMIPGANDFVSNIMSSPIAEIAGKVIGGDLQGALSQGIGMIPGMDNIMQSPIGGIIEAVQGGGGIKGVMQSLNPMAMLGGLAEEFGLGGAVNAIMGGDYKTAITSLGTKLGIDPKVLGVVSNAKSQSWSQEGGVSAEWAFNQQLEFMPVIIMLEKLQPMPIPVPINNTQQIIVSTPSTVVQKV